MTRREALAEAKRLVVQEGHSYVQASEATGIPLSTLQKHGAGHGWQSQRQTSSSYSDQVRALKAALLAAAVSDPNDSQKARAWREIEAAWPEHRYHQEQEDPKLKLRIAIEMLEDLVSYLAEASPTALAALQPHLTPFGVRLQERYAS